ncbi:methyltransferase domain-containing protein [Roseovarius sp. CAU 1744]|uniref:class I SAM-dependent methyltransferase n=1 Tax=Roseovarius sp. CAU 1744 TaxID=3140368 RepID=UPI00325BA2C7
MLDTASENHADLMDKTYRNQRQIYDLTRKYFLLGRDHLITELHPAPGSHVLEIACGTGRNLQVAQRRYPHCAFYGLDISSEMLRSARRKLADHIQLAEADACGFDGHQLFRRRSFDRIFVSYGISMIPDWEAALRMACAHLGPGGELHVVDFSDQQGLPDWFGTALNEWLRRFHVSPRLALERVLAQIARDLGANVRFSHLYRGYAQYGVVVKRR